MPNDYYDVLGVSKGDSSENIRKAFRQKAMEYHPDRNKNPDAEEKFKEVNEAYQILNDSDKRAQYDRFGHAGMSGSSGFDRPFDGSEVFGGFGDIFDSFFGDSSGRRANEPRRGQDIQQSVRLSFEEAVFGAETIANITKIETCDRCSGQCNEPGTPVETCKTCKGNGQVRRTQRSLFGQFAQITVCPTCEGKGKMIPSPCTSCKASGLERRTRKTAVNIPAGVQSGMQVRLTGEGNAGANGGPAGNLYIQVEVDNHDIFERQDFDLIYPVTLNMSQAALGLEIDIPTLDGPNSPLRIPNGTQPNTEFRIKGKGVPHIHSDRRGDLRVMVDITIPKKLTDEQRTLIEELSITLNDSSDINPNIENTGPSSTNEKGIFDRIKDALG
jgi:molecular chaperone DnaJ